MRALRALKTGTEAAGILKLEQSFLSMMLALTGEEGRELGKGDGECNLVKGLSRAFENDKKECQLLKW